VCPPKVLISSEQFSLFSCLFCLKKPSKFVSLSGFDLVGSFLDYYDVVSGPPETTIERLFFIVCVKLLSLSLLIFLSTGFFICISADKVETLLTCTHRAAHLKEIFPCLKYFSHFLL
jgi:hypothetical protein